MPVDRFATVPAGGGSSDKTQAAEQPREDAWRLL
jgi:hypothetical protein